MSQDRNAKSPPCPPSRVGKREIEKLVRLAERGEPKALECLRGVMSDIPAAGWGLTDTVGDMAASFSPRGRSERGGKSGLTVRAPHPKAVARPARLGGRAFW